MSHKLGCGSQCSLLNQVENCRCEALEIESTHSTETYSLDPASLNSTKRGEFSKDTHIRYTFFSFFLQHLSPARPRQSLLPRIAVPVLSELHLGSLISAKYG